MHPGIRWAEDNASLWTLAFCGAQPRPHSELCFSIDHESQNCDPPDEPPRKSQPYQKCLLEHHTRQTDNQFASIGIGGHVLRRLATISTVHRERDCPIVNGRQFSGYTSRPRRGKMSPFQYPSEDTLIMFITHLAQTKAHSTIKTYLAAVRHLHVVNGFGNPLDNKLRLQLILKGINWIKPHQCCPHLPVTPRIMFSIQRALKKKPGFDSTMVWVVCCIGFFGFMRSGEFTLPNSLSLC